MCLSLHSAHVVHPPPQLANIQLITPDGVLFTAHILWLFHAFLWYLFFFFFPSYHSSDTCLHLAQTVNNKSKGGGLGYWELSFKVTQLTATLPLNCKTTKQATKNTAITIIITTLFVNETPTYYYYYLTSLWARLTRQMVHITFSRSDWTTYLNVYDEWSESFLKRVDESRDFFFYYYIIWSKLLAVYINHTGQRRSFCVE